MARESIEQGLTKSREEVNSKRAETQVERGDVVNFVDFFKTLLWGPRVSDCNTL